MKKDNFVREIDDSYEVVYELDAKDTKTGIIFNLIAFLVLIIFLGIYACWLILNNLEFKFDSNSLGSSFIFLISIFAYLVLHELVHGLFYKIYTGEKLTFGISWSCAFCGVPNIYVKKNVALKAVLAPFVIFNIIFITLIIVGSFYWDPIIMLFLYILLGLHVGGCSGDLYVAYLLLKYKSEIFVRDIGPKQTFFKKIKN